MIDLLEKTRIFRGCSGQELTQLVNLSEKITSREGDVIFEIESPAEYLYVISDGAVELRFRVTHYSAPREVTLDRKWRGDAFGWSALTEPKVYTVSALATRDSELLRFKASDIEGLCNEADHLGFVIMRNVSEIIGERFATLQKMLIDFVQQGLTQREP
jgi:CRP-like cAMP-binding protein